jgi:hypothetical protein
MTRINSQYRVGSRHVLAAVIALVGVCLSAAPAFAHKLLLDCRVKGDRLRVEAFYDDNTPAQQAKIAVENESQQVVSDGRTDGMGVWSCPVPGPGKYIVRGESVGHAAKETVTIAATSPRTKTQENPFAERKPTMDNPSSVSDKALPEESASPHSASSREEKTETPWQEIGIGLAVIGFFCGALYLVRRRSNEAPR